ncbi:hypothetical protein BJV78DRAFT_1131587 [Lactifluus subvellereus]|nr:hypothetical protein BJV78DRAFT_1131587 [Lactifluus subvellereus]
MTIGNDMAGLIGFGCEAFFYGCYTILFAMSIHLMFIRSYGWSSPNKPILIISVFLYMGCSAHFALEFSHFYTVLTITGVKNFANETPVLMGADFLISATDFTGQLILIYRCWLLWSRNYWIIILPFLTSLSGPVCISQALRLLMHIDPTSPMAPRSLVSLGLASFTLPLCSNVFVTGLIAGRIWYLSPRKARDLRGAHFPLGTGRAAIDIVIESGALYMAVQLVFLILFAIGHPARGIVGVIAVQIYGIAPTLIIIRVALGLSSTPSGRLGSGAASSSQLVHARVRIGHSKILYTDSGQPLAPEIPMPRIKSKNSGEDLPSSRSCVENAV